MIQPLIFYPSPHSTFNFNHTIFHSNPPQAKPPHIWPTPQSSNKPPPSLFPFPPHHSPKSLPPLILTNPFGWNIPCQSRPNLLTPLPSHRPKLLPISTLTLLNLYKTIISKHRPCVLSCLETAMFLIKVSYDLRKLIRKGELQKYLQ